MSRHPPICKIALLLAAVFALSAGCCPCPRKTPAPPPPISMAEQVDRLNQWSQSLPLIKASMDFDSTHFDYRDDKGNHHSQTANVTLVIRQHFSGAARSAPADVYLRGQVLGERAFEAGRNDQAWWFSLFLDSNTAWVGDATRPLNLATLGEAQSQTIFRADLVPDLLGLSPLPSLEPQSAFGPAGPASRFIMMQVNDQDATNDLFIEDFAPSKSSPALAYPFMSREIRVDRFTGHISEVRLYDATGILVGRSVLSNYKSVTWGENVVQPLSAGQAPQFPRKIVVTYPAQQASIALQFDTVTVPASLPNAVFATPDFSNLRVIHED